MSDERGPGGPTRLINPTVRGYMEALNLERFYGGYTNPVAPPHVYNLGIGEVDRVPLEPGLWERYRRFIASADLAPLALRYSGTMGVRETNCLVAAGLNRWLGTERFGADQVLSVDGGQNAVNLAARVFTSPLGGADRRQYVLMAAPSYPYLSSLVPSRAGVQAFLAYDGEMLARGVETYCNPAVGMILLNLPHNPMGYALTAEQVARINRVARAYDCALVVDLVYAAFAPDAAVGAALAGLDPERTVFVDSFSKKYGLPGLRLGFALSAAEPLIYALRFVKMGESLMPSPVKLAFAGHLLAEHAGVPAAIAAEIRGRNERFREAFAGSEEFGVRPLGGAANPFYLGLDIGALLAKCGLSDAEVARHCLETHSVRVIPGAFIYPSPALRVAEFSDAGRPVPAGDLPFAPPSWPEGAQFVFAPDFFSARVPLLRLSFGVEHRIEAATAALKAGLRDGWEGRAGEP